MNGRPTSQHRFYLGTVFVFAFVAAFHDLINADYWFHLRAGASIASGDLPRVDSFSYPSAGNPYIDLHWLFQLGLYVLHGWGGVELTLWVKALLVGTTFSLLYHIARDSAPPWVAGPVVLFATVLSSERFLARPEVLSFLFLTLLLFVLAREARRPSALLFAVPPLFLVWANTEGIFVVGLGVLGAHVLQHVKDRRRWGVLALSLVAICLNPYGLEGALHPLVLFTRISGELAVYSSTIGEFLSPFEPSSGHPSVAVYPFYLGILALALLLHRRRPRISEAIIVLAFLFLSLKARRNLALFGVATAPILARWIWEATKAAPLSSLWQRVPTVGRRGLVIAGALLILGLTTAYAYALVSGRIYAAIETNRSFGAGVAELACPREAAAFLRRSDAPSPVFSDLSTGSYLIWADSARPVFIDGRLEVHETAHYARYLEALGGGEAWNRAVREFGFQTIVLDHGAARSLTGQLLTDSSWALCHIDSHALVLVRRDESNGDYIAAHSLRPETVEALAPPIAAAGEDLFPKTPGLWQRTVGWRRYPWAELGLGQLFFQAGRYDRAAEQYRRAAWRAPLLASPRVLLAGALNQLRRPEEALRVLQDAGPLTTTDEDRSRLEATLGDVLVATGRYEEAVQAYDRWLALTPGGPGNAPGRIHRAMALHGAGRLEEAAAAALGAIADLPGYAEGYRVLGSIEESRGRTEAARSAYRAYRDAGGTDEAALEALEQLSPNR